VRKGTRAPSPESSPVEGEEIRGCCAVKGEETREYFPAEGQENT